jgi:YVTN family beta-propeller protein
LTRRDLFGFAGLAGFAGLEACGRRKSPRYLGFALIANHDGRSIAFIDLSRFQLLKEIPLDVAPDWIFASGSRALVVSAASESVAVLDLDRVAVAGRIHAAGVPQSACLSHGVVWIAVRDPHALIAVDLASGVRRAHIPLPARPGSIDVTGGQAAISFPDARTVGRVNVTTGKLAVSQPLAAAPGLVRFRPDGKTLFVANNSACALTVLDALSLNFMVDLPLAVAPEHICFNSDGGQMFVTGAGMDAVAIVSPYQTEVSETILAGSAPGSMAATSAGPQYLFISNPTSGDVTVVNLDTRKVVAQIPVGQRPGTIALTPDNEYALVLNEQSGDVAVIRLITIRNANLSSRHWRTAPLFTMIPVGLKPVSAAIIPRLT